MPAPSSPSQSAEDYLERIHEPIEEKGYARVVDIASSLGVKQASVTSMVQKLAELGYLNYEKYRGLILTDQGREVARRIQNRHATLSRFFRYSISTRIAKTRHRRHRTSFGPGYRGNPGRSGRVFRKTAEDSAGLQKSHAHQPTDRNLRRLRWHSHGPVSTHTRTQRYYFSHVRFAVITLKSWPQVDLNSILPGRNRPSARETVSPGSPRQNSMTLPRTSNSPLPVRTEHVPTRSVPPAPRHVLARNRVFKVTAPAAQESHCPSSGREYLPRIHGDPAIPNS